MSSEKDGWADLIGEQTDPELGRRLDPDRVPTLSETPPPASLDLPAPSNAPTVEAPPPAAPNQFSAEDMVQKLQATPGPPDEGPSFWSEWKEVILTAGLGSAVLIGLALFPWGASETKVESTALKDPPTAPARAAAAEPRTEAPAVEQPRTKSRPAPAPVVSIVSRPPGAMVQIDGVVYGRTPLILPAPSGRSALDVSLLLDDYRTFEKIVQASEAGHFSLNVELEPRR